MLCLDNNLLSDYLVGTADARRFLILSAIIP